MARITVEDCVDKVDNRFELVLLASHRARQLSQGSPLMLDRDNDKNPVVALREIADEHLSPGDLKEDLIHSLQRHVEVDEPDAEIVVPRLESRAAEGQAAQGQAEGPGGAQSFEGMSEEELLAGIEGLVAPERNEDG